MYNRLGLAARQFYNTDNIVDFQRKLDTFVTTQLSCIKLLREEIAENRNSVAHIKRLDPINTRDGSDLMIEPLPSDHQVINNINMNVFLNGARADDILDGALVENPEHALSFDAFAAGLDDDI